MEPTWTYDSLTTLTGGHTPPQLGQRGGWNGVRHGHRGIITHHKWPQVFRVTAVLDKSVVGHHLWRCAATVLFDQEVPRWVNIKKPQPHKQSDTTIVAPCFADVYNFTVGNIGSTFGANSGQGTNTAGPNIVDEHGRLRRVTPVEAERLMGFPDDYTLIPGKCLESSRYKAIGNSMVIPVMSWLGQRIHQMHRAQYQRAA